MTRRWLEGWGMDTRTRGRAHALEVAPVRIHTGYSVLGLGGVIQSQCVLDRVGDTDASSMVCRKLLGPSDWKSLQSSWASVLHCEFCSSKIWNI